MSKVTSHRPHEPLELCLTPGVIEAGCDEAGRGCLAGPVVAAAVILPPDMDRSVLACLDDSKKLSAKQREELRPVIQDVAVAWAVAEVSNEEIDQINILRASFLAMHRAIDQLTVRPEHLLIDGNRFTPYGDLPHTCIVKGDGRMLPIAAASVLAKTHRDDIMRKLSEQYPGYGWGKNMGYPTRAHYAGIAQLGLTPFHRKTFNTGQQMKLEF